MNGEAEKTCQSCGKRLKEGASFCTNCGAAVGVAAAGAAAPPEPQEATQALTPPPAAAAPVPPVPPAPGTAGGGGPQPGFVPAPAPRKNRAALIVGILGGVLVIGGIAVLVLWLAVWRGGGGGGADDPIALAEKYIDSLEKGDIDAYLECFQEDFFINEIQNNPFLEEMGLSEEDIKEYARMGFEMMEVDFENVGLELSSEKGDKATVVTTSGTASVKVFGMGEELDLADDPLEFKMVKVDGNWYLTENPMGDTTGTGMDFDMEDFNLDDFNLEDFNLEDLEQYLPEDLNLEDLENLNMEDLDQLLEDLEKMFKDMPVEEETST